MIKGVVLAVMAAVLAAWMKSVKQEYGVWLLLGTGILMAVFVMGKLEIIIEELQTLQTYFSSYSSYIKLLIKIIGITYLAEISADLCRDAGANALAGQIELFGKLSILVLCMPIITALLETVNYFLGG